jgi:thioesterase domain-containing protein
MARQLTAGGQEVQALAIFDGYPPDGYRRFRHRLWLACVLLRKWWKQRQSPRVYRLLSELLPYAEVHAPPTVNPEWVAYQKTLLGYDVKPYGGAVHVLRSADQIKQFPQSGWEPYASEVNVHKIPGDHYTYIREHAREAAAALTKILHIGEGNDE